MAKLVFSLFGIVFYIVSVSSLVEVNFYEDGKCSGPNHTYSFEEACYNFPMAGLKTSSLEMTKGSCLIIYKQLSCSGDTHLLDYQHPRLCDLPCCGWNDHVLSIKHCSSRRVRVECPPGSYVRKIGTQSRYFNYGIQIHCYKPSENTPTYTGNTHNTPPVTPDAQDCSYAANGLWILFYVATQLYSSPNLSCPRVGTQILNKNLTENQRMIIKPKSILDGANVNNNAKFEARPENKGVEIQIVCKTREALVGISTMIDEVNVFKEVDPLCIKVPDPTSHCQPEEMLGLVIECDNSGSDDNMECSYSKTVGVGTSASMTEAEEQEMSFSMEFGVTITGEIPGLSATMSTTLGMSQLVDYEWSQTDLNTWQEETTLSEIIILEPRTRTRLEQLIGKCSFYGAGTGYFKRTDVNTTSGEETIIFFSD